MYSDNFTIVGFISSFVFRQLWGQSYQNQLSFSGKDSTANFFVFRHLRKTKMGSNAQKVLNWSCLWFAMARTFLCSISSEHSSFIMHSLVMREKAKTLMPQWQATKTSGMVLIHLKLKIFNFKYCFWPVKTWKCNKCW